MQQGQSQSLLTAVSNRRRWGIVALLFAASLINYLDRATISYAVPLISVDLHLDPVAKGVLLSAFFLSYALMQVPTGLIADRVNLRWLYAGAFALWSLAQGFTGLAESLAVLIVFRIVLGIGESIYLPGGTKIVALLFEPTERGLPSGVFDCGTRGGLVLGGVLIPSMLVLYGWRHTFMLVGFSALLWLIPWLLLVPRSLQADPSSPQASRGIARPTFSPTDIRNLVGICLGFFCFDYYWYIFVTWLPDYLVNGRHLTMFKAGIYSALPYFVFGISEPIGGWLADRLIKRGWSETRTRKGIVAVAFLTGLFLVPAMQVTSAHGAVALIVTASLVGLATGNLIVILQCCAPPEQLGLWTGIENFAGNVGGILAPFLTGVLLKVTGSYVPGFLLGPALLLAGIAAYWFIVGDLQRGERTA